MDNVKNRLLKYFDEVVENYKKAIAKNDELGRSIHFGEVLGIRSSYAIIFNTEDEEYEYMCTALDNAMKK